MYQIGEFWAEENSPRKNCYKVIPQTIARDIKEMTMNGFNLVYEALGKLGYKFRDAGHDSKEVIVSLNKPISKEHLKHLEDSFFIEANDGTQLGFC